MKKLFLFGLLLTSQCLLAQLKIAKAPFIHGMGVLCALTGLVHLYKALSPEEEQEESTEGGTL